MLRRRNSRFVPFNVAVVLDANVRMIGATNATLIACGTVPRDQSATIIAIPASFGSLGILMVILRVVDRLVLRKVSLDWDDYLVVIAVVRSIRPHLSWSTTDGSHADPCMSTKLCLLPK